MKPVDLNYAIGLAPQKAIEYFKSKGYAFSWDWHDVWQEAHNKAFTVAKAMRMDVLQDIHDAVQNSITSGQTFEQFKKNLTPKLQAKGWWGRKLVGSTGPTGKTEGATEVQLGSPWRLKTIYNTNMQTSYMAGKYREMKANVDVRPYWQYIAVMDSRTRPTHAALNGKVFMHDDPFWKSHFPPNGFNCRCRPRNLSASGLKRSGAQVESSQGLMSTTYEPLTQDSNELVPVTTYHDPVTGMDIAPDKGWSYCPGSDDFEPQTLRPTTAPYKDIGGVTYKKPAINNLPARLNTFAWEGKSKGQSSAGIDAFLAAFGAKLGQSVVYQDAVGDPLVISQNFFKSKTGGIPKISGNQYLPMLAETIQHPAEIWLTWVKTDDGTEKLVKRYIGVYKDAAGKINSYAVFDNINGAWQGKTIFDPKNFNALNEERTGTLLFPKSIKK